MKSILFRNVQYLALIICSVVMLANKAHAEAYVSGLADFVMRNSSEEDLTNVTFKSLTPFSTQRTRLFFDAAVNDDVSAFVQVLNENGKFVLYGAYVRFEHILGQHINSHVGFIPNTIGSWGPRTYSNVNPLIGTPLLWVHHSSYMPSAPDSIRNADQLLARAADRTIYGLPVLYDACWNSGIEIFGEIDKFSYSVAALSGSVSKPALEQEKDIPQFTTHLTYSFSPGFVTGISGFYGPYLPDGMLNDSMPFGTKETELINAGVGGELYIAHKYLEIWSEVYTAYWEHPYVEKLTAMSGYIEAKYKISVGWYLAGRFGFFESGKLANSSGQEVHWDFPVKRYEAGIGYKPNRTTTIKLVAQINKFDFTDKYDNELYATQISVGF